MTTTPEAFDHAAGRAPSGEADDSLVAWARRVIDLRREGRAAEPCPPAVLARARGLLAQEAERGRSLIARLLFDSAVEAAPAMRGASSTRLLRFERQDVTLDIEIGPASGGLCVVHLACLPATEGREVWLLLPEQEDPIVVPLDAGGVGRAEFPADTPTMSVHVFEGRGEIMRTSPVSLGEAR